MTPNEIFTAPSLSEVDWRDTGSDTVQDVFGISGFPYSFYNGRHPVEEARIVFARKLSYSNDDDRSTNATSLSFDGRPFALLLTAGEDGHGLVDCYVTDANLFDQAREHVAWHLRQVELEHDVVDGSKFELQVFHDAVFVNVGGEVRFANPNHCRWEDGALIFDEVALRRGFNEHLHPLYAELRTTGLANPEMRLKALSVLKGAVPSPFAVLDIDHVNPKGEWIACAFSDGSYTHVIRLTKEAFSSGRGWMDAGTIRVGPPSILHALECKAEGRVVPLDSPAVEQIEETFGLTGLEAVQVIEDWLEFATGDLLQSILVAADSDLPVDPVKGPLEQWRVYAYLTEHPEAYPYCHDGLPTIKQAREIMSSVNERLERAREKAPISG